MSNETGIKRLNENTVQATVTTKVDKDDPAPKTLTWILDYTGVTRDELMDIATRAMIVKLQGNYRRLDTDKERAEKFASGTTFSVSAHMIRGRQSANPVAKAKASLDKLSPEDKAALIAELNAQLASE